MTRFFKHPRAIERFRSGPLAGHIDRFAGLLFEQGYSRVYARKKLWLLRDLDRWLDRHGLRAAELDEGRLAEFACYRGSRGCRLKLGSGPMLKKFLAHLRDSGAAPAPAPILSRDANSLLERAFAEYLAKERGVCSATIDNYLHEISRFLAHRCRREPLSPSRIDAKTLNVFVLHRARQVRHPPQSGWLDGLGRLKGGRAVGLDAARCASYFRLQNCPLPSAASCSRMYWRTCSSSNPTVDTA